MPGFFLVEREEASFIRPTPPEMPRTANLSKSEFSVLIPGLEPPLPLERCGHNTL